MSGNSLGGTPPAAGESSMRPEGGVREGRRKVRSTRTGGLLAPSASTAQACTASVVPEKESGIPPAENTNSPVELFGVRKAARALLLKVMA